MPTTKKNKPTTLFDSRRNAELLQVSRELWKRADAVSADRGRDPVAARQDDEVLELMLTGVVSEWMFDRVAFALEANPDVPVDVKIYSGGGDAFAGAAISNLLRDRDAVTTRAISMVASAATDILLAGDVRLAYPQAQVLIHQTSMIAWGNADEFREWADQLDRLTEDSIRFIAGRTNLTEAEARAAVLAETTYNAEEALEAGLVTGLVHADAPEADGEQRLLPMPAPERALPPSEAEADRAAAVTSRDYLRALFQQITS